MILFQRYVFQQALLPFLTAISALTGLAVLTQSLSNFDLIADQNGAALVFMWVTILAMPQIVALLLPITVFIAVASSMNRLVADSELIVGAASGMSRTQRLGPFLRLAIYVTLANLVVNLFVQPLAFREMRQAVYELRTDIAANFMRAGEFIDLDDSVTFFARSVADNGVMQDVFIQQGRGEESRAFAAALGQVTRTERGPVMLLQNGVRSETDENGELLTLAFDRIEFDLAAFIDPTAAFFFKESDKYLPELLAPTASDVARARGRNALLAEGHYRLSAPLYNLAFALIAAAAFMSGEHRRTGYGRLIIIAAAAALMLRILGFAVQAGASDDDALNVLQYGVPLLGALAALGIINRPRRLLRRLTGRDAAEARP